MNVIWSKYVQGAKTLYYSRKLRFDDMYAEQYKALFDLDEGRRNLSGAVCPQEHLSPSELHG